MEGDEQTDSNPGGELPAKGAGLDPLEWPWQAGAVEQVLGRIAAKVAGRRRRLRRRLACAGAAALIVAGSSWYGSAVAKHRFTTVAPVVSLPASQAMPDGSVVELNVGAEIRIDFTPTLRRVELERGEAHFQVAKNKLRPFVVLAKGVEVRAVGTAFSVQVNRSRVEVLVTEGRVAVGHAAPAGRIPGATSSFWASRSPPTLVGAGNGLVVPLAAPDTAISPAPVVFALSEAELNRRLSWRVPKLEFSSTPLAEALPTINRYCRIQLVLGDPELGKVRLSGILRANNVETLLRVLASDYGITAERRGQAELILRKTP